MHPILTDRNRTLLYFLGWVPITAMLVLLCSFTGAVTWIEAVAVLGPTSMLYAFACLSVWYICRTHPVSTRPGRMILSVAIAGTIKSALWTGGGQYFALMLPFPGLSQRLRTLAPLLFGMGFLLYALSAAVHYLWLALLERQQLERRAAEARVMARDAELRALKAQLNPHFLFNSLHSISALVAVDPKRAREMCVLLGDFLRKTLGLGAHTDITFGEEIALARNFLGIERVRFGQRLLVDERVEGECIPCLLPPLILQPLFENAVSHGIARLVEGGTVTVSACRRDDYLEIMIENPYDPGDAPERNGVGLENTRRRLAARFGDAGVLRIRSEGALYRVEISVPCEKEVRS